MKNDDLEKLLNGALNKAQVDEDLTPYIQIYQMYSNFVRVGFEKEQAVYMTASIVKEILNGIE